MRTTGLPCRRALCVCLVVVATITAAERGDRATKVPAPTREALHVPTSDQAPANLMDLVSPLPRGRKVIRDVIVAGGVHEPAPYGGSTAGTGVKVYSNTLGPSAFGPSGNGGVRIADDIATTGLAGCALDRYVIRVTGDKNGTGDTRPLTVTAALYDSCPGAVIFPTPIANTQCVTELADGGIHDVVCTIPALATIPVPSTLYVAVTFDRGNAGWIVGAPAEQGFSADRFDFPGFACAAALGGFPEFPHASFYTQIFVRACGSAFPAYRNTKQSGSAFTPGRLIRFGDDITLTRSDCKMTGYVVSVKGTCANCSGVFQVDLKTSLSNSNPESGNRIPGTAQTNFVFTNKVQVFPFDFDPPIELTGSSLFITFATDSDDVGPIVTSRRADIGNTVDAYVEYQGTAPTGEWVFQDFGPSIWSAFDVTVFCEGDPPAGACCDMFLLDENGDSVCRDLPEINCASSQTAPSLWREGKQCGVTDLGEPALCLGGDNVDQPCSRQADCPGANCTGGTNDGGACTTNDNCPGAGGRCVRASCPGPFFRSCGIGACCLFDDSCEDETRNGCDAIAPTSEPRLFTRGTFCNIQGQTCPKGACIGREGSCFLPHDTFCLFGENAGEVCDPSASLPFPNVTGCHGVCVRSGAQDGASCLRDLDCSGDCARTLCEGGSNDGSPCRTDNDCPFGACTLPNCPGAPGCQDPFCCSTVCSFDSFCCEVHWDGACATAALQGACESLDVANDRCSDPDAAKGARLLNVPDSVDGDTRNSITSTDEPGFCCNGDDPGGPGLGTIWYKFVAPPPTNPGDPFTSVVIQTCQSNNSDSLLQLFALENPDQGVCSDLAFCSVSAQDCSDGSVCEQDPIACGSLIPIGCSDDNETCFSGQFPKPFNSKLCAPDLIPGDTYYFMVAAKASAEQGIYRIIIGSPCSAPPPLPNDLCEDATLLAGSNIKVDFDLSGMATATAPVTFDCPGPNCGTPTFPMANDAWYEWIAPANGQVEIDTCGGFACVGGTDPGLPCAGGVTCPGGGSCEDVTPETTMVVYEGCDCPVDVFNEIDCDWFVTSLGCFLGSSSTFDVVKDTCYKVRLGGRLGETPAGDLEIRLLPSTQCGNGVLEVGEECDDGGESVTCDADCTAAVCGDGTLNVTAGEECDDGLDNSDTEPGACRTDCAAASCGDGAIDTGEECDGMADAACPGACLSDCTCGLFCGDGACDPNEDTCNCPDDCGTPPPSETPGLTCLDGLDNDCDGLIDLDDPDCADEPIPTISAWGLILMALLLLTGLKVTFGRRRPERG